MVNAEWLYDRADYLVRVGSCKNLTISTDKCVGPSSCSTSQLKIRVPIQVSSTVYEIEDSYLNWTQQKWEETNSTQTIQTETQHSEWWIW